MADLDLFQSHRPLLFSIAYRMLGSASDAEDVVQDAWVRLSGADASSVRSAQAFATTIVTRLCLDRLKSARAKREEYVGPWLPEPVLTAEEAPDVLAQRSESVTLAFLVLLETLSAEERAVFLLKEVFDYQHADIAEMLGTTAENSRQLFHRAKVKVSTKPSSSEPSVTSPGAVHTRRQAQRAVAERFAMAFKAGDTARVRELLTEDVTFVADGGGKALAARRPLAGREAVSSFLFGIVRSAQASGAAAHASVHVTEVNTEPALVLRVGGTIDGVFVLTVNGETIQSIRVVRNPDKLAYIDRQLTRTH